LFEARGEGQALAATFLSAILLAELLTLSPILGLTGDVPQSLDNCEAQDPQLGSTSRFFSPGPIGFSIATGFHKPGDTVMVRLEALEGSIELPGTLEVDLYRINEEGGILDVLKSTRSAGPRLLTLSSFEAVLPKDAPARYCLRVVIRSAEGQILDKLVSIIEVPEQKLDATLTLSKNVIANDEEFVYTITNRGPTWITFGEMYNVEYLDGDKWVPADVLSPNCNRREDKIECAWILILYSLDPGRNFSKTMWISDARPGVYRIVKEVNAEGTELKATLAATFTMTDSSTRSLLRTLCSAASTWVVPILLAIAGAAIFLFAFSTYVNKRTAKHLAS
jgi:hypothetical protein